MIPIPFIARDGYLLRLREASVEEERAAGLLAGRRRRSVLTARREADRVLLTVYGAVCPHCGKEIPLCGDPGAAASSPQQIDCFFSGQYSLFGDMPDRLIFHIPGGDPEQIRCPRCHTVFHKCREERRGTLQQKGKKIRITLEVGSHPPILWAGDTARRRGPFTESLTFHLGKGRTYLSLEDGEGDPVAFYDITDRPLDLLREDPILQAVEGEKSLYRELQRLLQPFWGGKLPFSRKELDLNGYRLLTRFVGYDRDFYAELPLTLGRDRVEGTFASLARQLHRADRIPRLLEKSSLPRAKSLRRLLFTRPSLMFYLPELEALWPLLKDLNYLTRFLSEDPCRAFSLLAYLHRFPAVVGFLREYGEVMGNAGLFRLISCPGEMWMDSALSFLAMNDREKRRERERWLRDGDLYSAPLRIWNFLFSLPVPCKAAKALPDRDLTGFSFRRLRNTGEYRRAGRELKNCLVQGDFYGDVYGVLRDGRYVAAVEVIGSRVEQAAGVRNVSIAADPVLFKAFRAWASAFHLVYEEEEE